MDARASDSLFWEEAFAWAPFEAGGRPDEPALHPAPEQAVERIRARRDKLRSRRLARSEAARRRRRTRLYPLAGAAAATALVVPAVGLLSGGERVPAPRAEPPVTVPAASPPPPPAATFAASRAVERAAMTLGDRGEHVRALQHALARVGFDPGVPDASFEAKTRDAVASFQLRAGLAADGVVGASTAGALVQALVIAAAEDASAARAGLAAAVADGRLAEESSAVYLGTVDAAFSALEAMTLVRAANLSVVLADVAAHSDVYDEPRALALFGMLETNAAYLARRDPPEGSGDVMGEDGVVYRFFRARGFQFHPLANFATLNAHVTRGRDADARTLATSLVARGVPDGEGFVWEYYFPFGGPERWTSGFAQAVAADALARAAAFDGSETVLDAARRAFLAIPKTLARPLGGGLWIREYDFSDMPILNAQLQTLVSLMRYAEKADDAMAAAFASELETAARTLLPEFSSGDCWSLYSLGGNPATEAYHRYHVTLLEILAEHTGEPVWAETARRWKAGC